MSDSLWHALTLALLGGFALLAFCVVALMRQVGSVLLLVQPHVPKDIGGGPEIGQIEDFDDLAADMSALVVFVAPDCEPCHELAPTFPAFRRAWPDFELVVAVARGNDDERQDHARALGSFARADLRELYERWEVQGTPFAVALDRDHRVRAKGVINTFDQMEQLALATTTEYVVVPEDDDLLDEKPVPMGMGT
jgi:thiol-disulfide isomerase/thioredoxin